MKTIESNENRFVILYHQYAPGHGRSNHWDLMLEDATNLMTWALDECPGAGRSIAAVRLANHRSVYLDFEGGISGDRGWVTRIAIGNYCWGQDSECRIARLWGKAVEKDHAIRWNVVFDPEGGAVGQPVRLSFEEATGTL